MYNSVALYPLYILDRLSCKGSNAKGRQMLVLLQHIFKSF